MKVIRELIHHFANASVLTPEDLRFLKESGWIGFEPGEAHFNSDGTIVQPVDGPPSDEVAPSAGEPEVSPVPSRKGKGPKPRSTEHSAKKLEGWLESRMEKWRAETEALSHLSPGGLRALRDLPVDGAGAGGRDAGPDRVAAFAGTPRGEFVLGERRHLELEIDAIEQRTGDPAAVPRDLIGRAAAARARMSEIAARTRIHRGDELEHGRELRLPGRARHADLSGLERLAEHFEHVTIELGQLVEEQHAVHRHRDLARPRIAPAAIGRAHV